jgi:hypothetical protein
MSAIQIGACLGLGLALLGCAGGGEEGPVARAPVVAPAPVVRVTAAATLPSVATTQPLPVTFARLETRGVRVVYVCDLSGSMMNKFESLREALRRSVAGLRAPQSYAVVFFQDDGVYPKRPELRAATAENEREFERLLGGASAHGSSDAVPALREAFALEPDTIFILTDGDFPNNAQVLSEIRKLNKDRRVKVHTLAYIDRGEDYEKFLRAIAEENGGTFRIVEGYVW